MLLFLLDLNWISWEKKKTNEIMNSYFWQQHINQYYNDMWSHGVMVSTLDSESSDPSSNLGGTYYNFLFLIYKKLIKY